MQKVSNQDKRSWTEYTNCALYEFVYLSNSYELGRCAMPKNCLNTQINSGKNLCM